MNDKIFLIFRALCLCGGLLLFPDAFLPTKNSLQEVDRLTKETRKGATYYLVVFKSAPHSCSVDIETLNQLKPKDIVRVYRTLLWDECTRIEKDDVQVYHDGYWRLFTILLSIFTIAIGVGWIDLRYWWRF